jgi:hypothetical protein
MVLSSSANNHEISGVNLGEMKDIKGTGFDLTPDLPPSMA